MGNLLTLLIILIFIFRGLSKLSENAQKEEEKEEPRPAEWKQYFESVGLPPAHPTRGEKEEALPPQSPCPTAVTKETLKPDVPKTKREKPPEQLLSPKRLPLSLNKVKEGIILAEILGPPRAKKNRPSPMLPFTPKNTLRT